MCRETVLRMVLSGFALSILPHIGHIYIHTSRIVHDAFHISQLLELSGSVCRLCVETIVCLHTRVHLYVHKARLLQLLLAFRLAAVCDQNAF